MANLAAGDRFCGNESRCGGRLAQACQKAYKRFQSDGFLSDGMPVNYGSGGSNIVRLLREKKYVPMEGLSEQVHRGDIDRLLIEWKSLLRQVASANTDLSWLRWTEFQNLCRAEIAQYERTSLPGLPVITAEQQKPISHRLAMSSY
jgi:hypothetical protein